MFICDFARDDVPGYTKRSEQQESHKQYDADYASGAVDSSAIRILSNPNNHDEPANE